MLKTVVHHNEVYLWVFLLDTPDGLNPVFAHHNNSVGKLAFDLLGLVAHVEERIVHFNLDVAFSAPTIAPRKNGYGVLGREIFDKKLHGGCFARATNCHIANTDNGNVELRGAQNFQVIEPIAHGNTCAI